MKEALTIVTGCPRSGTSLMVRMVDKLGIPPVARPFLPAHKGKYEFNPGGFYDSGLWSVMHAKAIRGCMKVWGGGLKFLPPGVYTRIIVCTRAHNLAVESHARWLRRCHWPFPRTVARWIHDCHDRECWAFVKDTGVPVLTVELSELVNNPLEYAVKIGRFIKVDPDRKRLESAAALVRKE